MNMGVIRCISYFHLALKFPGSADSVARTNSWDSVDPWQAKSQDAV